MSFEDSLNWAFSQIIAADDTLPTPADQKAWLLAAHNEAVRLAGTRALEEMYLILANQGFADEETCMEEIRKRIAQLQAEQPTKEGE